MPQGCTAQWLCEKQFCCGSCRGAVLCAVLQSGSVRQLCWGPCRKGCAAAWLCEKSFCPGLCHRAVPQSCSVRGNFAGGYVARAVPQRSSVRGHFSGGRAAGLCRRVALRETILLRAMPQSGSARSHFPGGRAARPCHRMARLVLWRTSRGNPARPRHAVTARIGLFAGVLPHD